METIEVITPAQPAQTLARWWYDLNEWTWPADLPGQPDKWADLPRWGKSPNKREIVDSLIKAIEELCPLKERQRYVHAVKFGRSSEDFESWWDRAMRRREE